MNAQEIYDSTIINPSPQNRQAQVVFYLDVAVGGYFAQPVGGETVGQRQSQSEWQFYPDVGQLDIHSSRERVVRWEVADGVGGVGDETLRNSFKSDGVFDDGLRRKQILDLQLHQTRILRQKRGHAVYRECS